MAPKAKSQEPASAFPLNEEQRAAVEHGEGPLLVVAGAGTGKTRVITERIATLLASDPGLKGENILGLTFTDKAAAEMKHRVTKAAGDRAEGVWLSTFHAFCLEKVLRAAHADIQALDEIDHRILLRRNIGELGLVIFRRLTEPAEFLKDFQAFFSRCQDELVTPDDYQQYVEKLRREHERTKHKLEPDARRIAEDEVAKQEELARVYRTSERLLRERNLCTFGGQLAQAVELLRTDEALLEQMREQYRYILVDEFQDTNIAQLELLWLLAGERGNIVAVGDDDQAIYRFRGASFGSFTIFLERFCNVDRKQAKNAKDFLVSLSQNYRSTQKILRVAGAAIQPNEKSPLLPEKKLTTQNREGEKIRIAEFANLPDEAHWVASEIERLHEAGAPWRSFAVLYRKHTHREPLVSVLRQKTIPFVIRRFSILDNTIVRDMLAWLRLIVQPAHNVSCARVLAAPYWGLEPRDLVRLAERAAKNKRRPLWDEVEASKDEAPFNREGVRLNELAETMARLRRSAWTKTASEMLDDLTAELSLKPLPFEDDRQSLDRLSAFVQGWERKSEKKQLRDFIEYLNYFNELSGEIFIEEEPAGDVVQLMTVHAAKGLEFPNVFILRLNKKDFPSNPRPAVFEFPPDLMREEQPKGDFHFQEERRLFYVALTRARERLTLSTVVNRYKRESMFLEDILSHPKVQKLDTSKLEPRVEVREEEEPEASGTGLLFGPASTRAYSRIALWAKAFHPPLAEPLQLTASSIKAYEQCPMKYLFQYVWLIRGGPHGQMTFGKVMHETIREFVHGMKERGKMSLEDVLAIYEREWSPVGFPDEYQEKEYKKAGREQLESFYKSYCASPADVLYQEKTFELPLENNVVITGRMDQVNTIGEDGVDIIDYKTGKKGNAKKASLDIQLSIYALAA